MRSRRFRRLAASCAAFAGVAALVAFEPGAARAQAPAPADSGAAVPATPDSVAAGDLAVRVGPARTSAFPDRASDRPGELDTDRLRFDGRGSVPLQFRERWPVTTLDLPLPSEVWGRPFTPDAGVPAIGMRAAATDRTPVAGYPLRFGVRNAATAIAAPGPARNDPLLVSRWSTEEPRPILDGPGELFASPRPVLWWEAALLDRDAGPGATESALFFERGDFGVENAGARFTTPSLGPGMAAAYTRRTADGADAFWRATDVRYAAVVMLPARGAIRGRVEGDIAKRRIEDAMPDAGLGRVRAGESLLEDRSLSLRLERGKGASEQRLFAEAARSKHTGIEVDGLRERWEEPTWTLGAESRWSPGGKWTWIAAARATGRDLRFRAGPGPTPTGAVLDVDLRATRREGRAGLAVRRGRGAAERSSGWGADVVYDAREEESGFLDARLHAFAAGTRGSARLDVESAHERPTWEDRLLPERERIFSTDVVVLPLPVRYVSSGNPFLRPRRLSGAAASGSWRASKALTFTATGSAHRVEDDFGWSLTRSETADTIVVTDRAVFRGRGWSRQGSVGFAATGGRVGARALGWARGGPEIGTPQAGSPPRLGLDASIHASATLFRGDLPLRLSLEARVLGPRDAPIRAASTALFAASLHADFDDAGVYLRADDLFDRRPPSGVYEISTDGGAPTAGRRLRLGVVWHLLD